MALPCPGVGEGQPGQVLLHRVILAQEDGEVVDPKCIGGIAHRFLLPGSTINRVLDGIDLSQGEAHNDDENAQVGQPRTPVTDAVADCIAAAVLFLMTAEAHFPKQSVRVPRQKRIISVCRDFGGFCAHFPENRGKMDQVAAQKVHTQNDGQHNKPGAAEGVVKPCRQDQSAPAGVGLLIHGGNFTLGDHAADDADNDEQAQDHQGKLHGEEEGNDFFKRFHGDLQGCIPTRNCQWPFDKRGKPAGSPLWGHHHIMGARRFGARF